MTIAVVDHQLGRDGAHAGRGRHVQRGGHVLGHGGGRAAQHLVRHLGSGAASGRRRRRLRAWPARDIVLVWRLAPSGGLGASGSRGAGCVFGVGLARRGGRLGAGFGRRRWRGFGRRDGRSTRCAVAALSAVGWSARGSSRQGTHANSDRPRRDPRGTCDTSPRPTTRSVRMVKLNCSRQLLASIPSPRQASPRTPPVVSCSLRLPRIRRLKASALAAARP